MTAGPVGGAVRLASGAVLPLARAFRAGDMLYVSGQLPLTAAGKVDGDSIEEQTERCLTNIAQVLSLAGASLADVVKTTVWLKRPEDFAGFNHVYGQFFAASPPARSTVVADLVLPEALVEIEAVAWLAAGMAESPPHRSIAI